MIKAIRKNQDGSLVANSEREFSEHLWAKMNFMFGDKLRWVEVKEPKKAKKKVEKIVDEVMDTVKEITDDFKENNEIEEPKE